MNHMNRRNLNVVRLLAIGLSLALALALSAGSVVAKKDHGNGPFLSDWPVLAEMAQLALQGCQPAADLT